MIQPQHKGRAFKWPAKGQCLNCMDEREYGLTVPANREGLIYVKGPRTNGNRLYSAWAWDRGHFHGIRFFYNFFGSRDACNAR